MFGHNYCNYIVHSDSTHRDDVKKRLIGKINKETIQLGDTTCEVLLDSGSVISCVSEEFYTQFCSDIPLQSLDELFEGKFTVTSASTNPLNILGYIELNVRLPGTCKSHPSLFTVIADSILTTSMPALIGSNILEAWKHSIIHSDDAEDSSSTHWPSDTSLSNTISIPSMAVSHHNPTIKTHLSKSAVTSSKDSTHTPSMLPSSRTSPVFTPPHIPTPSNEVITATLNSSRDMQHSDSTDRTVFLQLFKMDKCPADYRPQLEDVLWNNRDSFAVTHYELGKCDIVKHDIELSDYTPIKQKYRRIAPQMFDAVKDELQKLHEQGVIRPSMSPWCSPVSIAVKPDGSPRLCLDLRKVNDLTKKDAKSMPNIQEMFDRLNGKTIFSSLDLYSGFLQIELEEACKEITAFTCGPLGFWEMNRMPFGACNSSATFQRTMETVLGNLLHTIALVYIDDIIVHSTSPTEHIESLDRIFRRLNQHGLRLKPSKCTFFSDEIKFLGHMVTSKGLQKDPTKIQAILDWPRPTTVTQVRQFMGLCGFIRKFIPNFATIASPITDLTRGYSNLKSKKKHNRAIEQTKFEWTQTQEDAFLRLKNIIAEDVTLAYADFNRPFRLTTDACRTGLGAILEQQEVEGHWRPIGFASRRTNETERNYPTHKLEFLSLRWAITEKFSDYLRTHHFTVYSDNNPLTYILTNDKLDATAQRWVSSLEPYSFTIKYKPGVDNTAADALSRKYEMEEANNTERYQSWAETVSQGFHADQLQTAAITIHDTLGDVAPTTDFDWIQLQDSCPSTSFVKYMLLEDQEPTHVKHNDLPQDTKNLLKHFDKLVMRNDLLYYQDTDDSPLRLVIPTLQQGQLTKLYHSLGHTGMKKVLPLLQERFYWNNMKKTVSDVIITCDRCQKAKTPKHKNRGPLQHITSPSIPMYQLSMDFLLIDTRAKSKLKLLTVIDEFTKFSWAIVIHSENAKLTAEKLYRELYTKFGIPSIVHTDRGQTFLSNIIKQLNKILSIKHTTTTSYRPQSNATCERLNKTIISRIRSLHPKEKTRWNLHVDSLIFAYNCTVHESIGMSPYYAMFGRHPKLPLDFMVRVPNTDIKRQNSMKTYAEQRENEMKRAFEVCAKNIRKRQIRSKRNFDDRKVHKPTIEFNNSDKVLIVKHVTNNKVDDHYLDEVYEVIERKGDSPIYVVQGIESFTMKSVHRDNIILYKQTATDQLPVKPDDLQSWQDMHNLPEDLTDESPFPINKHLNRKVAIYYGKPDNLQIDHLSLPTVVNEDSIETLLQGIGKHNATVVLLIDNNKKQPRKNDLKCVLQVLRQEISKFCKVILNTNNITTFNSIIQLLYMYFPKTKPLTQPEATIHSNSESESSIYENIQIPLVDSHIDSDDSSSSGTIVYYSSDSEDSILHDTSSSSDDSSDNSDDAAAPRYNMRIEGRRPPRRFSDYFTAILH